MDGEDHEQVQAELVPVPNSNPQTTSLQDHPTRRAVEKKKPKPVTTNANNKSDGFFLDMKFVWTLVFFEVLFVVIYGVGVDYPYPKTANQYATPEPHEFNYSMFQDIHGMMFIGFGFLMTFLRRYGFGALGINFLLCGFCVQWAIFMNGYADYILKTGDHPNDKTRTDLKSLYDADMATAAVLISFGGSIGRATPLQLIWMAFFELFMYAINFEIVINKLQIFDAGGSIAIHIFGAYFGLAVSWVLGKPENDDNNKSMYHSDIFAMIGTLFLWIWWPSFNAVLAKEEAYSQERAVINTVLSLSACIVSSFAFSKLCDEHHKFDMVHVQNATLAGGVAVGSAADLYLTPMGAILIGLFAGIISVIGYVYIQPFLQHHIGLYDTCGIHNLHGMPGIYGGIVSAVAIAGGTKEIYHDGFFFFGFQKQAARQIAAIGVTLGLSILWGLIVGFFLKVMFSPPKRPYEDSDNFKVPEADALHPNKDFFRGTIRSGIQEDI